MSNHLLRRKINFASLRCNIATLTFDPWPPKSIGFILSWWLTWLASVLQFGFYHARKTIRTDWHSTKTVTMHYTGTIVVSPCGISQAKLHKGTTLSIVCLSARLFNIVSDYVLYVLLLRFTFADTTCVTGYVLPSLTYRHICCKLYCFSYDMYFRIWSCVLPHCVPVIVYLCLDSFHTSGSLCLINCNFVRIHLVSKSDLLIKIYKNKTWQS